MLKILVKKQMAEIFRAYLYDAKKNKARTKVSTVMWFTLFALIMVGVLGVLFFNAASSMKPLILIGMDWFYFILMGAIAIIIGAFGSVFNTFSALYMAKDNDFLLSMPIPVKTVVAARLAGVYLMGLLYSATASIPTVLVFLLNTEVTVSKVVGGILWVLIISVVVMALSTILGFVVAQVATKLKHKNYTTVAVSLVFIGLYYFVYFKASDMLQSILENAVIYGDTVQKKAYPLYLFGQSGTGDVKAIAISVVICTLVTIGIWIMIQRNFLKIVTSTGKQEKMVYHEKTAVKRSPEMAVLLKEFGRFTGSATYMMNCGLGIIFMLVAGVFILFRGGLLFDRIQNVMEEVPNALPVLMVGLSCLMSSMNDPAAPSVSLEGKSIWITRSLPVKTVTILRAKLLLQVILTAIPCFILTLCICLTGRFTMFESAVILVIPQLFVCLMSLFGLCIGLLRANLSWTNEIYPIKQSLAVIIALFGGWIYAAGGIAVYLFFSGDLTFTMYALLYGGLTVVLCITLGIWLVKVAPRIYETLS